MSNHAHASRESHNDEFYMSRALQLARQGWFSAHPNPRVGCVIVNNGAIVGEGYHQKVGEAHAEINALAMAGKAAQGAEAYVSLEPCNHQGRTGPCSQALIEAGISTLIYAMTDPNEVAGGGIAALKQAGISVRGPVLKAQAQRLNAGFIKRCQQGLPVVTLKMAMSVDGRTAMDSGESQWITGADARADVQRLRAQSGAIITGIGSVLADNPAMTVRASQLPLGDTEGDVAVITQQQPLRVIVDSRLQTPVSARILQPSLGAKAGEAQVLIATASLPEAVSEAAPNYAEHVDVLALAAKGGLASSNKHGVDLHALLQHLAKRGCNDVLVEAGSSLAGSFVAAGLVDTIVIYMAAKLMGSTAKPLFELPFEKMAEAKNLIIDDIRAVGNDWRITAHFSPQEND